VCRGIDERCGKELCDLVTVTTAGVTPATSAPFGFGAATSELSFLLCVSLMLV